MLGLDRAEASGLVVAVIARTEGLSEEEVALLMEVWPQARPTRTTIIIIIIIKS